MGGCSSSATISPSSTAESALLQIHQDEGWTFRSMCSLQRLGARGSCDYPVATRGHVIRHTSHGQRGRRPLGGSERPCWSLSFRRGSLRTNATALREASRMTQGATPGGTSRLHQALTPEMFGTGGRFVRTAPASLASNRSPAQTHPGEKQVVDALGGSRRTRLITCQTVL
jgi:hypothetical protein